MSRRTEMFGVMRLALLAGALLVSNACYFSGLSSSGALMGRLKNRGPVALSSENPFLAGNLLISREMEASPEIKGFIERRGAPAAIEVTTGWFSSPSLVFYYPENREQFTLERADDAWVIAGPSSIERDKMKRVAMLTRNVQGPPSIVLPGEQRTEQFKGSGTAGAATPGEEPIDSVDEPPPARASLSPFSSPAQPAEDRKGPPIRVSSAEEDERLIKDLMRQYGNHQAEISPRGDVVHYVTYAGETLSIIARWYTFDRRNAGKIARINLLQDPDTVGIGDEIIIPGYLAKNRSRLTEEALRALTMR